MRHIFSLLIAFLLFFSFSSCSNSTSDKRIVAILTPASHPSLEVIEQAFIRSLEQQSPSKYQFIIYNGQGNKSLIRSEIEEIARSNSALVLTIGAGASQMTIEYFTKKNISIPIVFTAVNDPRTLFYSDLTVHRNTVTGVEELLNFKEQLSEILLRKDSVQNLLLVYNPLEPGLSKDKDEIKRLLAEKNIGLTTVEVFQSNEIQAKVLPFIEKSDALLIIKDNTVVGALDILVKLCNRYKVPLITSDLDSPDKGAAMGYGVYENSFGEEAAKQAFLILNEGKSPSEIPIAAPEKFSVKINEKAAEKQGLKKL